MDAMDSIINPSNRSAKPSGSLDLPPEIRDMIYEATQEENHSPPMRSGWIYPNKFEPGLRLANRQLSREASAVFCKTTTFKFAMGVGLGSYNIPLDSLVRGATKLYIKIVSNAIAQSTVISTNLLPSTPPYNITHDPCEYYLSTGDYRAVLRFWEDNIQGKLICLLHSLPGLRELTINIVGCLFREVVESRPTMRLDGLRAIRGLRKVGISGRIDEEYARSLEEAMESPA